MANNNGRTPAQRPDKMILSRTLIVMIVCGIVAFVVLAINLYKIQIIDHDEYEQMAVDQQTKSTTVSAERGTIYDRNGNAVAMSATAYTVYISPYEIQYYKEDPEVIADGLSKILDVDSASIMEKTRDTESWYKTISKKIEPELADKVRAFISEHEFKGIHIENDTKRYYPYGSLACHVIGFVGDENYGLEGIEARYDDYLTGTDGSVVRLTTANGTDMLFEGYEYYYDAVNGSDVNLTIDVTIQSIAEKYLEQAVKDNDAQGGGCCIVMRPKTGEILALASLENYELNNYLEVSDEVKEELEEITDETEYSEALKNAQYAQWRNKALSDTYEPGSVFKIITMAIGLEEDRVPNGSSDLYYCGGSMEVLGRDDPLNCWKTVGHGPQTLTEAAMHSCNVAFVNMGLQIGAPTFYDYISAFGLFNVTGIDLAGEASSQWWSEDVFCNKDNLSQLAAASFGQTFNITPLQMITAISAVANGGYLMEPYLVSSVVDESGEVVYSKEPTISRQVIGEQTSKTVCEILENVVGTEGGTGSNAYVAGYRVAGKTGTTTKTSKEAETGVKEYMVSFCGFAPADDPEVVVLVILDNPSNETGISISGGVMAAPAVGNIISEVLPYLNVEPQYDESEKEFADVTMPKVTELTVREATDRAEELGLSVRVVGDGETVTGQLPAANATIASGTEVVLYAGEEVPDKTVTVPSLYGMTANEARNTLESYGLYLTTSGALPSSSDIVVSVQSVESGAEVKYGTVIKVTLIDSSNIGQY